ncbi:hypothetical protein MTO96_020151 [Rhipicephalus appendiculatus]
MKIKFDFTRRQERPLIVGFQAEGQRYVELQEDTTTPSLLETIAHIAGATVDGLVAQELATEVGNVVRDLNVPVTLWSCPTRSPCYGEFVRYVTQYPDDYPRPALVLVPQHTTVPLHVLKEIPRFQMYYSNVDWVFSVKEHAGLLDKLGELFLSSKLL